MKKLLRRALRGPAFAYVLASFYVVFELSILLGAEALFPNLETLVVLASLYWIAFLFVNVYALGYYLDGLLRREWERFAHLFLAVSSSVLLVVGAHATVAFVEREWSFQFATSWHGDSRQR